MYVHLGGNCIIKSEKIIGIFNLKGQNELFKVLKKKDSLPIETEDLTKDGDCYSCILTEEKVYLSAISTATLKKRAEESFLTEE